ncbi:hypothetical protein F5B22DRAFT_639554 [Xylaria bambusicola]|uniref:uncharacterized protein n=1 Tax=Xylaria bambusicola TaxID=326684 RepID=UPI0020080373|nr:uncharacterized protein F5B22DRAFT_639554 [Xylaria bambusicola]KAI0505923.1 hypothetical protein F5B22DRAFT_639554 [Xylaria bambusicola]
MLLNLDLVGRGPIIIESTIEEEKNIINWVSYGPATDRFYQELWAQRDSIEALVKHHLALNRRDMCCVLPSYHWIRGSFNVCVFVEVMLGNLARKVIFRCPMPHKLAETRYPGSIDEKLGSKVGAHVWIEENCSEIRSPHLFGFGMMDGLHFTHTKHLAFFPRVMRLFWRFVHRSLRPPLLSHYALNPPSQQSSPLYILWEYLGPETGEILSDTFDMHREDKARRQRLFRGISRIMISLARLPQAHIGSFQLNDSGTITLTNRPLTCSMAILENDGAIRTMPRNNTINCTDAFPNAVNDESDCRTQMAVKTLLRVVSHNCIKRGLRNVCALPAEKLAVPYWLTVTKMRAKASPNISLSEIMHDMWGSKRVWFWYCLSFVNAMYFLLEPHLLPPKSLSPEAEGVLSRFWSRESEEIIREKLADKKAYDEELRALFNE